MPPINLDFEKARLKFNTSRNQWRAAQNVAKMGARNMIDSLKTDACVMRTDEEGKETYYKILKPNEKREHHFDVEVVNGKRHGIYTYHVDYFLIPDYKFDYIALHQFEVAKELLTKPIQVKIVVPIGL